MSADAPAEAPAQPPATPRDALDAMARAIGDLHRKEAAGPLAALRRLDVDHPVAPAFHALLAQTTPDHLFAGSGEQNARTRRFAHVARMMALKPDGLGRKSLGSVLGALKIPESRLAMLLNAQGATLDDLARRVARRVAASDEPLPYRDLGLLLLWSGRADDAGRLDELRLKIARDYARAARAASASASN